VIVKRLGPVAYDLTLEAMRAFTAARDERTPDELWLCEHAPVFTQGVAGGVPVHRETVALGDLCRTVIHELAAHEIVLDDQLGVPISVDPERISQVIDNLVTNAVRYGTGPVTVKLSRDGNFAEIAVHNDGPPIPREKLATLFDPYRRATSSRGGIGLGLYIVEQIARAHGGTVHVTSTAAHGTTFAVRIPML